MTQGFENCGAILWVYQKRREMFPMLLKFKFDLSWKQKYNKFITSRTENHETIILTKNKGNKTFTEKPVVIKIVVIITQRLKDLMTYIFW